VIVTQAEVYALKAGQEKLCALMQQTIMVMHGKEEK
jgi:acyl-coenzyme A thioesterase PaaI-like protein